MQVFDLFGVELGTDKHPEDLRVRLMEGGHFNLTQNLNVFLELLKAADKKVKALETQITALEEKLAQKTAGVMNYRGVHEDNLIYAPGDCCTRSGALWVCKYETASKPPGPAWSLAVKSNQKG